MPPSLSRNVMVDPHLAEQAGVVGLELHGLDDLVVRHELQEAAVNRVAGNCPLTGARRAS